MLCFHVCITLNQDLEAMASTDQMASACWGSSVATSTQTPCIMAQSLDGLNLSIVLTSSQFPKDAPLISYSGSFIACLVHHEAFQEINLGMVITRVNCRFNHTFIDEDCIGGAKALARRCHRRLLEFRLLGRFLLRLKTLKQRTAVPVRSARAVIKKNRCAHVCNEIYINNKYIYTPEKSYMSFCVFMIFYDL